MKNLLRKILLPILFLAGPISACDVAMAEESQPQVFAALRRAAKTWSNGGGNNIWSNTANWSGGLPAAGDTVTFDATSTANCTVDNIGTFNGTITIATTYSGTITQSTAVSGISTYSQAGGTWNRSTFGFDNGANAWSLTGGTFSGSSGTMTTGGVIFNGTSSLTATSGTWNVGGSWTQSGAGTTFTANGGTINYTAPGGTITDARSTFNLWTINSTAGTVTIAASTTIPLGTNPSSSINNNNNTLQITGTVTWAGTWAINGALQTNSGGTLTGTSTPQISIKNALTINSASTITNAIGTITFNAAGVTSTLTDTGDKLSGTTYVINQTSTGAFTVAASTTCRLGTNPTSATGSGAFTNNGTVTYAGLWTHTGTMTAATGSTTTGTGSPSLAITNSLTISATASAWTSVNIAYTGAGGCTYTDTGAKNSGTWSVNASAGWTVAASTSASIGATPTTTVGGTTVTITGTLSWSGTWTHTGQLTVTGTLTGTATPRLTIDGNLTTSAATITNTIGVVTFGGGTNSSTYTDTGDKLSASSFAITRTGNAAVAVAASTTLRLGATPTSTVGTSSLTITGTLTYSGTWTHTGNIITSASSTVTGTGSPALVLTNAGSLAINATTTSWTSVNITVNGTGGAAAYTDTAGKNTGIWTFNANSSWTNNASSTMAFGTNPTLTFASVGQGIASAGTLTFAGNMTYVGSLTMSAGGTLTGTSSPTITMTGSLNVSATATVTNTITPITYNGSTGNSTHTDTGDKLSASTCVLSKTGAVGVVVAASTTMRLGTAPTSTVPGTLTVTGTLTYAGLWTNTGPITVSAGGTVTGSGSPSLATTGSLNISATGTWTSVNVSLSGTTGCTYTDTGAKNSGTWTLATTNAGWTVAASTSASIGTNPSTNIGSGTITVTGTLTYAGTWNHVGQLTTSASSTVTGSSSPSISTSGNLTINATTTSWTSVHITFVGGLLASAYTDTGAKNNGTITFNKSPGANWSIAASTTANLGTNASSVGTATITGTLQYAGTWSHNGNITTASGSTVTGSSTPSITVDGSLTINTAAAGWTSVPVTSSGVNACTYTDTAAKNSGVWTINKTNANVTVAASTSMDLGTNPTSTVAIASGSPVITVNGTLTFAGTWTHHGLVTIASGGTLTGTGSPSLNIDDNLTVNSAATITNPIPTITVSEGASTFALDDAGDKLNASTYISNKTGLTIAGVTISTAGTVMRLGANPTWTVGTVGGIFSVSAGAEVRWSGTWTLTGPLNAFGIITGTSTPVFADTDGQVNFQSGTITNTISIVTNITSSTARSFLGGSHTFGSYTRTGSGTGGLTIFDNNTWTSITDNLALSAHKLQFGHGSTQNAASFALAGSPTNRLTVDSDSAGSPATLHKTTAGNVSAAYLSIKDSTVDASPLWQASNSVNVSGNTNWIFLGPGPGGDGGDNVHTGHQVAERRKHGP